jgi:hypothetical protein
LVGQVLVELAVRRVLQDEINTLVVVEVAVHTQNVLVTEVGLDFDLLGGGKGREKLLT